MSTTFQIVTEGRVYIFSRRELKFQVAIEKAHKVLRGESKGESGKEYLSTAMKFISLTTDSTSTFDAVHKRLAEKWLLRDDVVKPFGVRLENLRFVCTFDLDQDLFTYSDVFTEEHIYYRDSYVRAVDVPYWEPYENRLFSIGDTTVVLHQDLQTALKIAKDEAKENSKLMNQGDRTVQRTYLLLSVRHMMVCHFNATGKFLYTAPTVLMDGLTLPSPTAITLLLQALKPSRPPPRTPVHDLPLEIQDRILEHVSKGPVEAARLGCFLGLGSPFTWMRAVDWPRRGGPIKLFISPSHRHENTPVESKIYFGDVFSGVSYR
ncbi:hypothetical protein DL98DRAFT_573732 [Cadophora sp. DSE1049]|nr:hypothetical protein DL98DRAFT_573732 [Cadophora sp. DSE1049]